MLRINNSADFCFFLIQATFWMDLSDYFVNNIDFSKIDFQNQIKFSLTLSFNSCDFKKCCLYVERTLPLLIDLESHLKYTQE